MAKGGKGRKGGGGGAGPKQRKYERDNNGRFASTGSGGATARGGRLLTAKGNKRTARALAGKTKTIEAAGQKGVLAKPKGLKPRAIKAKPAAATAPKAAKLPREQRLARASVTAKRIDKKLQAKADEAGAAFAERRRISSRASSKARTAAFGKEAVAGKASATASRASQRSNARVTRLNEEKGKYAQAARDAATKSTVKPAPKLATKPPEPAVKIAKRKPLTSAQIAAGREADRREMASVLRKPARWLAPTPVAKPARFSASELAERKGYAKQLMAQPKGVRKANYLARKAQKTPDQLDKFKGRIKFGTQNTINNITEGRNYLTAKKSQLTNTPEKRASIERSVTNSGRSLQARMKTTNLGTRLRRLNKPVTTKAAKTKGTISKPKGLKLGNIKPKAAAKPARAARTPKTGQEVMKSEVRKVQNKKLRDLNAKLKSAGPNATSLRVEKLALKTKMIDTQPRQTAKQLAKSAKQDVAIRGRIAEMRKQNARVARAQSNVAKNADVRNSASPMSKASFARRPSKKTMRSQLRADNALAFYANPAKALREVKKKPGFRKPRGMR